MFRVVCPAAGGSIRKPLSGQRSYHYAAAYPGNGKHPAGLVDNGIQRVITIISRKSYTTGNPLRTFEELELSDSIQM